METGNYGGCPDLWLRITFILELPDGIVNPQTRAEKTLLPKAFVRDPAWSPDSTKIAFSWVNTNLIPVAAALGGHLVDLMTIYAMNRDGSELKQWMTPRHPHRLGHRRAMSLFISRDLTERNNSSKPLLLVVYQSSSRTMVIIIMRIGSIQRVRYLFCHNRIY